MTFYPNRTTVEFPVQPSLDRALLDVSGRVKKAYAAESTDSSSNEISLYAFMYSSALSVS